ncbi:DNA-methyltransferase [Bacteroides fragilis]
MNKMELDKIYLEDCLIGMDKIPDNSIDAVICDLPYGTTQCEWDKVIPFDEMWRHINRVIKPNAAIVLFGAEPFSSYLRLSNPGAFKYDWIWDKKRPTGQLNAKKQPLRQHEIISVFYYQQPTYNPVMHHNRLKRHFIGDIKKSIKQSENYGEQYDYNSNITDDSKSYPRSIIEQTGVIGNSRDKVKHPQQKPVSLIEYLIQTYTNQEETVLDLCIGSGTTAVACINLNRHFIGFEKVKSHYDIACKRISEAMNTPKLAM